MWTTKVLIILPTEFTIKYANVPWLYHIHIFLKAVFRAITVLAGAQQDCMCAWQRLRSICAFVPDKDLDQSVPWHSLIGLCRALL